MWASLDRSAGRAGIRAFVVDAGTPGMYVTKVRGQARHPRVGHRDHRASRTAASRSTTSSAAAEVPKTSQGFKGVMATFDATRPIVAASALGVGARGARLRARHAQASMASRCATAPPPHTLTALERDFMEMEAQVQAARLLTWRAAWMMDNGIKNNLEASMCKAKAGLVVTWVTQKAVELLGPLGYSRELLVEKWMRDAKISDIYEGTQQINQLIIARRILGYSSEALR